MTNEDIPVENKGAPGASLRKVRQSLGLTEDEVAIQLHLSRGVIEALENDQFEQLHGTTFARGYLRAYAKLLNLPAEEIIASFNTLYPDNRERAPAPDRNYKHLVIKQRRHSESSVKWIGYTIIVIMIALVITWWHNHDTTPSPMVAKTTKTSFQTPTMQTAVPADAATISPQAMPVAVSTDNNLSQTATDADNTAISASGVQPAGLAPDTAATSNDTTQLKVTPVAGATPTTDTVPTPALKNTPQNGKPAGWHNPDN